MINTKLTAKNSEVLGSRAINLLNNDGECIASFANDMCFYIVTGFKSAEAYNVHHDEAPVKFLMWKREN